MQQKKFTDRRRSNTSEENSISDVLKLFMQQNQKISKGITKVNIVETWKKVMGPGVNSYTRAIQIKGNVLYVSLSSSIIREELSYGKEKIIRMINEDIGQILIKEIVLR